MTPSYLFSIIRGRFFVKFGRLWGAVSCEGELGGGCRCRDGSAQCCQEETLRGLKRGGKWARVTCVSNAIAETAFLFVSPFPFPFFFFFSLPFG